jgi:hypothetical protein
MYSTSCYKERLNFENTLYNLYNIQGVSEFHRETFRVDSVIKNKNKTLNTYGVKNA